MAALDPSVAATRTAVRRALAGLDPRGRRPADDQPDPARLVLVACSGGADSLALAAATSFVAPRLGWRAGLLTVDHQLQVDSRQRAEAVAVWGRAAGLAPVWVLPVTVAGRPGGPEAAARAARYEALAGAARQSGAAAVLLGHTRDDQAETVLLALARGAGPRGLAGMPARRQAGGLRWLRPLLDLTRVQTGAACAALAIDPWHDPHNTDPSYARSRVRHEALPALVAALGERVVANLAQTARQLAADTAVLDQMAAEALASAAGGESGELAVAALRDLPDAIRSRVLHAWARQRGVAGSALSHRHVAALDALVMQWHGQGPTQLPGGIEVRRIGPSLIAGRSWT